jgi:hypothetical protein
MIQPQFSLILAGLFLFGIAFNAFIGWAEKKKYLEGFVALAVVFGTLITVGAVALVYPLAALINLLAFAASGLPMLAGSIVRYITARTKEQEYVRQTEGLAQRSKASQG